MIQFKKRLRTIVLVLLLLAPLNALPWGFWAHQEINRFAVFALPSPLFGFYKQYIGFVTSHATDPDKRRYAVEGEAACHFIDLDRYGKHPFDSIPQRWNDAVKIFGEDSLRAHGIVPWHIITELNRLTSAFKNHNLALILKYSSDIGHYIADAHVPLHCTANYNGQLTGQEGIHGLWESRVPELLGSEYDHFTGKGGYIDDPLKFVWGVLKQSYAAHDSVLQFESELTKHFPPQRKYAFETKGNTTVKTYSRAFAIAYDRALNGMAERRMQASILAVASFWYTAWVNAGQPDLNPESFSASADSIEASAEREREQWKKGKLKVRTHDE
ncbi:MAG TPA: zinc dependent phospholipase C family protein [Bacteroidia bacterium]|nr:zinc dependent phospholipase C family protein [Bacteroidia bacterium]